jgi:hypothetical protein
MRKIFQESLPHLLIHGYDFISCGNSAILVRELSPSDLIDVLNLDSSLAEMS